MVATALNPLHATLEENNYLLQLLAWYFEDRYAAVEGHYDTHSLFVVVEKLAIVLGTDLKEPEADCLLRFVPTEVP